MDAIATLAKRFPDKRVLITGATSGLGEALALRFARQGFRVGVAGRNPEKIANTTDKVNQAGGRALPVQLEVTRLDDFHSAAQQIQDSWGGLDILFNNAGMATAGGLFDFSLEAWRDAIDIDLWSVIHGCRLLTPLMIQSGGGHVANIASAAGILCPPEVAAYSAAKAAVVAISETLQVELASNNIKLTVCCPTIFKSGLLDEMPAGGNTHMHGVTADGLRDSMLKTSVTSDDVADHLLRSMAKRKLYSVPMRDARTMWRLKRYAPESYSRLVSYLYRHKMWVFNPEH